MTPDARRAERRARLLEAGLEVFGTTGYATSAIPALSSRAGVSNQAFYEHFASREDLLVAVYDAVVEEIVGSAVAALGGELPDLATHARRGIEAFVAPLVADERKARVNFLEVVGVSAALEAHRREVMRAFAQILAANAERQADAGRVPRRDLSILAMALTGATNEPFIDWFLTPPAERMALEAVVDTLTDLYVAALAAPPASP